MGIRKVKLEDVIPPKEVKTYSEAVYFKQEYIPPPVREILPIDNRLIRERLLELEVYKATYFPEYRMEMRLDSFGVYRNPHIQYRNRYSSALRRNAIAMELEVSIYWVRTKGNTATMRVTLK